MRQSNATSLPIEAAANSLKCAPRTSFNKTAIRIACVGDSITAGVCSSGGEHPYPQQLQLLLDSDYGKDAYSVTNLGACGSTMLKAGDSPYWERPQFDALKENRWDIVTIMLGTNDAKDPGSKGPNNWKHDCGGVERTTLNGCSYGTDYESFIELVRTLGPSTDVAPNIFVLVPPPLMEKDAYGMNQTVINSVFPKLIPLVAEKNDVSLIDVYGGMGGETNWSRDPNFPTICEQNDSWAPCQYWCDSQSCDECHPNDVGYAHLAHVLKAGLGL